MGNVTSNLIENALQSSMSSPSVSTAEALTSTASTNLLNPDNKLREQIRLLAADSTKLELYRLLQQEMEKQTNSSTSDEAKQSEGSSRTEGMLSVESDSAKATARAVPTSSSTSSTPLCPKKKFLKEYLFDDSDSKASGEAPLGDSKEDDNGAPEHSVAVSAAPDGAQSSGRSRSYTVSLPVRSRGPSHDARPGTNASSRPGDQQQQHLHPSQGRETSTVARLPLEGMSRVPHPPASGEARSSYVIDREHGPASSVAAYNVARQQRRDEPGGPAPMDRTQMNPARTSRHVAVSGEHEVQVWPGPGQAYYYVDQNKVGERSTADGGAAGAQQMTKEQRTRQQPLPTSAVGYRFEHTAVSTMAPSWRHGSESVAQGGRVSMAPRVGPSSTWSGPSHHQPPEVMYSRQPSEHVKDYELPGGRASKYRIVEGPASTMPAGYQYSRSAAYDQQKTGYSGEARKYVPVDVSRAAYPAATTRRGGNGESYDTARRQVHEQIETMCALPPPLFKQHPQRSSYGGGGGPGEMQRSSSHQVSLPRPLEPVEPSVRPKLAGLMHSDGAPGGYDRIPTADARLMMSRSGGQPRDEREREYDSYVNRQSRQGGLIQQQQQRFVPAGISPSGIHPRLHQESESSTASEPASGRHHQTVETPLDLSFRKDEPVTMTAEAFLRRVQDPQHFASTRPDYSNKAHYSGAHEVDATAVETEMLRQSELRRADYRHQMVMTETSSSSGVHPPQQSPRHKLELVPDWVSSRAAPIGHPGGQQQHHQQQQQQRGALSGGFNRRQVFEHSPVGSSYAGVSPGEARLQQQQAELMSTAGAYDTRVLMDTSSDEAAASWERHMHAMERARMQSWESGSSSSSSRHSSAMQQSSESRPASMNSSKGSKFDSRDSRSSQVSQQPVSVVPGNRMSNPLPQSGGVLMTSYDSRQPTRSVPGHYAISSGMQSSGSSATLCSASVPGVSSLWMSKEKQERLGRQERQVVSDLIIPSDPEIRRARSFEMQSARMAQVDSSLPVSRASSPSLPQLSPVPSTVSLSANAAANRRIPIVQLLGSHSPSDILHLRCNVCSSTYGSLRSFRMHFAKVHGLEPGPEHFTIQTISETRTAIARGGGNQQESAMLDCLDDSSLPPPSLLCETGDQVVASESRRSAPILVDSSLNEQLPRRESMPPVKQVAEVYPIPKKSSPIVVVTRDLSGTPDKPSPPLSTVAKLSSSPMESSHPIRCHRCYQFSTHDWALYRRHVKMHGPPSADELPLSKSPTTGPDGGDVDASSEAGCEVCLEGFSDVADWQSHITKSHFSSQCMMRSCACKSCDVGFTNAGALRRHLAAVHGVVSSSSMKSGDAAVVDVEYRCLFCPEAFSDERSLYVHTQAHEHHYMLQRSTSSSLPISRRYAFMHGSMPSPVASHRVQTAVPDTTCPEDQRPSADSAPSAGNSKSGSEDGSSLSSEKSPRTDPVVEEAISFRCDAASVNLVSKNSGVQVEVRPRGDSLKASILRRLSTFQETCDDDTVVAIDKPVPSDNAGAKLEALGVEALDDLKSTGTSSPGSDRSNQTTMGDFVARMHLTVENSLRGFSVAQPTGTTPSTTDSLASLVTGNAPNHRVRDLCDSIIANSFRQSDASLPQTWPSSTCSAVYLGELSRRSPAVDDRRLSPSDSEEKSGVQVFGALGSSVGFDDIARQPVRSDSRSSPRFDKDLVSKVSANSPGASKPVVSRQSSKRSDGDDGDGVGVSGSNLAKSDEIGAVSDPDQTSNDVDLFDDEPPLCIDLNRASSDDEEPLSSPVAATVAVVDEVVQESRDLVKSSPQRSPDKRSDNGERFDKSPKKRRLAEALAETEKEDSGSNSTETKRKKSSVEYSSA